MSDPTLISPRESRRMSGALSESTQRRLIESGDYPKPVVLSRDRHGKPVRIAFVLAEVQEWCRRRIEAGRASA
jgi:predicted DNA-binding transcriptional regulator AlpA